MQWDKVKNILLVILVLVDGFLAAGLAARAISYRWQQKALLQDVQTVLQRYDVTCGEELRIPVHRDVIVLEVDRSRANEENFAKALLEGTVERADKEDGQTVFTGSNGTVSWSADGAVDAEFKPQNLPMPAKQSDMKKTASAILAECGVSLNGSKVTVDIKQGTVTVTTKVADMPVFNRRLVVSWQGDGEMSIKGKWYFQTPYTVAANRERLSSAEDALLSVARGETEQGKVARIDSIEPGYRLDPGAGQRLLLTPCWKVVTDVGTVFVDAI